MRTNIEERALSLALYIIEERATVRSAAKKFKISKSTVHTVIPKWNGLCGPSGRPDKEGTHICHMTSRYAFTLIPKIHAGLVWL